MEPNYRLHLNPDDMTPEERLERIVELLAEASLRLIDEQEGRRTTSIPALSTEDSA